MRYSVPPFFLPQVETITHSGWSYGDDQGASLPRLIEAWDFQAEIKIVAGLAVGIEALRSQARLHRSSRLQVLVVAKSSSTKVERCVLKLDLPELDHYELVLDVVLSGEWLGGRLTIETMVVATVPVPVAPGGATEAGSILWSARHDTVLEGQGGLFPTDSEDFAQTRPRHKDAPWVLAVDQSDMDSLFAGSVRLTLNSGSPAVALMLADPTKEDATKLARILELDVTRQLALVALQSADVLSRPVDHEAVALGDVLRLLVARIWPTASTASLQGWSRDHPERLELDVQQFVKAFK